MSLEPGRISPSQAVYLVIIAIIGTATLELPGPVTEVAGRDGWAAQLLSSLITLVPGSLWLWAASRMPGKDFFEMPVAAAGRAPGFLINLFLVLWVLTLVTGAGGIGADLIIVNFLTETPEWVVVASMLFPATMAAHARLEVVARLSQVVFWAIVILILSYVSFSTKDAEWFRLKPMLTERFGTLVQAAVIPLGIMSESLILVAVLPYLNKKSRGWGLLFGVTGLVAALMILLTAWMVALFGPALPARFHHPIVKLSHIISVADILERLDAFLIVLWVTGVVAKVAFWYWLLCLGIARTFGLKDYRPLVWPLFPLVMVLTVHWATNGNEYDRGLESWTTFTVLGVGVVIPLVLLLSDTVRRMVGRAGAG